eukprot:TRINITY_DN1521_c0_g1_i2.p5 TRINITY_DN1521_c0_g1~~TRINITY_DN1521_c0_g1_i2.p5  ORF type:complete len:100 (+),score=11.28 TRINITY_DN1521_c0_g1_i2:66-365(+)
MCIRDRYMGIENKERHENMQFELTTEVDNTRKDRKKKDKENPEIGYYYDPPAPHFKWEALNRWCEGVSGWILVMIQAALWLLNMWFVLIEMRFHITLKE